MTIRLAVLDVDGTLLDPTGAVTSRVREAVNAAHDRGCLVTLASGRRLWAVRPIAEALGIKLPVILYNGSLVYDLAAERALMSAHLARGPSHLALRTVWEAGFQPVLYESPVYGERVYTGPEPRDTAATTHYFNRPTVQPVRLSFNALLGVEEPLLLAAMGEEREVRALEYAMIERSVDCQTLVERQSFVPGSRWWQLDVTAPRTSKGEALRRLCELAGILPRETLAVGDGINDLGLIHAAGLGVAMGNAVDEVRRAAHVVVADNANHGAAEALERFVIGRATDGRGAPVRPAERV